MKIVPIVLFFLPVLSVFGQPRAVPMSGIVVGWGGNDAGQATGKPSYPVVNGKVVITHAPFATGAVTIAGHILTNVIAVSAGSSHSLALTSDGTVFGWGGNQGAIAIGTPTPYPHRAAGMVSVDGHVLSNIISIAAANSFSVGLRVDGTVVTWGRSTTPEGLSNVAAVAAGYLHALAVKRDGTVVCWGDRTNSFVGTSNIVAVAVARSWLGHDVALTRDGVVIQRTSLGQETVPVGSTNVLAIVAGHAHGLALKRDGTIFGWGSNGHGEATGTPTPRPPSESDFSQGMVRLQGEILTNVTAIAAGQGYSLALRADGTVVTWGDPRYYKGVPAGLSNVVGIAAGEGFRLAITTNSQVAAAFGSLR